MRVRRTAEQDLEDTRTELTDARAKAAKWNGRVQELEELVTEKENILILRAVRSVTTTPENLRELLDRIKDTGALSNEDIVTKKQQEHMAESVESREESHEE